MIELEQPYLTYNDSFNMVDCKEAWTSLATHFKLSKSQYTTDVIEKGKISYVSYEQIVNCFMYLMVCTRFDIALWAR